MSQHLDAYKPNKTGGFTLIEALVALTILTVGLIPAFNQASAALQLSASIRNSLAANNLAQEGIELVRAIRDDNWFARPSARPFDSGLDTCAAGCRVQFDSTAVLPLAGNPPLKQDPVSGLLQYTNGTATPFSRAITITKSASGHELTVISTITYTERSNPKTYSLEYHMFNWLQ